MKAVSYERKEKMAVGSHPKRKLRAATDAILRVTTSGIRGSDLHMYDGRTTLKKGTVASSVPDPWACSRRTVPC